MADNTSQTDGAQVNQPVPDPPKSPTDDVDNDIDEDDLFGGVVDDQDVKKPQAKKTKAPKEDAVDFKGLRDDLILGTAFVDVRHLKLTWHDTLHQMQRPSDPKFVQKLVTAYKDLSDVRRIDDSERLIVAISKADFEASITYTAQQRKLDGAEEQEFAKAIKQQHPYYSSREKVPYLLLAPDNSDKDDAEANGRVDCRIQAGQHRTKALLECANVQAWVTATIKSNLDAFADVKEGDDARQAFGWTVELIDKDLMVESQYRSTLMAIRQNVDLVYHPDSDGVVLHAIVAHWKALEDAKKDQAKLDFDGFLAAFVNKTDNVPRYKRILLSSLCPTFAEMLGTAWGKDIFTIGNLTSMIAVNCQVVMKEVADSCYAKVDEIFPKFLTNGDKDDAATSAAADITAPELAAIDLCFTKKSLDVTKLAQLFFPRPATCNNFGLADILASDFDVIVKQPRFAVDKSVIGGFLEDDQSHRRPQFLSRFSNAEYTNLFHYLARHKDDFTRVENPINTSEYEFMLPTATWWNNKFSGELCTKFGCILRLLLFCTWPQSWKNILALRGGSGSARALSPGFDFFDEFFKAYTELKGPPAPPKSVKLKDQKQAKATITNERKQLVQRTLTRVFNAVAKLPYSIKEITTATEIDLEYLTEYTSSKVQIKFWSQLLRYKALRSVFDIIIDDLGIGMMKGIAKPIAADYGDDDNIVSFFDLPLIPSLSCTEGVDAFTNKHVCLQGLNTDRKKDIKKSLYPIFDVFTTSAILQHQSSFLFDFFETKARQAQVDEGDGQMDLDLDIDLSIDILPATGPHAEAFLLLEKCIERFQTAYPLPGFKAITPQSWLRLSDEQKARKLPHLGMVETGVAFADELEPRDTPRVGEELPNEAEIRSNIGVDVGYQVDDIRKVVGNRAKEIKRKTDAAKPDTKKRKRKGKDGDDPDGQASKNGKDSDDEDGNDGPPQTGPRGKRAKIQTASTTAPTPAAKPPKPGKTGGKQDKSKGSSKTATDSKPTQLPVVQPTTNPAMQVDGSGNVVTPSVQLGGTQTDTIVTDDSTPLPPPLPAPAIPVLPKLSALPDGQQSRSGIMMALHPAARNALWRAESLLVNQSREEHTAAKEQQRLDELNQLLEGHTSFATHNNLDPVYKYYFDLTDEPSDTIRIAQELAEKEAKKKGWKNAATTAVKPDTSPRKTRQRR